jgi:CBS domain-containing protein
MKVKDVMTTEVLTVREDTPFKEVVDLLVEHRISGVPVVDGDGKLLGIVTEADLVCKEAFDLRQRRPLSAVSELLSGSTRWSSKAAGLTAGQIMTTRVVTARPDEDLRAAARRMLDLGVKRLPVADDGKLRGIVSRQDLLQIFHRSDTDIRAELEVKMASPLWAPEDHAVTAIVTDGVVTLLGSVRRSGEVPVMIGLARDVPGVVEVESRMTYDAADGHERPVRLSTSGTRRPIQPHG